MFADMIAYNLDTLNNQNYRGAALGFINYFHGINPTAFCYLTNMGSFGAENSVNEVYHGWFADGSSLWDRAGTSAYGPAPGLMPGGVNPTYALDGCCPSGCSPYNSLCNTSLVTPPLGQPIQKSYRDWNTSWPQNSWTITEPGIYTQASYVRLISGFLSSSSQIQIKSVIQGFYDPANNRMNKKDTVRIYLRNITSPYSIADSSKSMVDSVNFTGSFVFSKIISGNYYIVLKHRNSLETWSRSGGENINPGTAFIFDFKSDSSNAYGMNVVRVDTSPLTFALYNGDVNLDGIIDATDVSEVDNDAGASLSGYIRTDLTGDNFADADDISIADNNSFKSVSTIKP